MAAATPRPPYYAVIFTAERTRGHDEEYTRLGALLPKLAAEQEGFLGIESVESPEGEITVSYWSSEAAIRAWKEHEEHRIAQQAGKERLYARYTIRVARVEREYSFEAPGS